MGFTTNIHAFTNTELISVFEAIRDELGLKTIQNLKSKDFGCYNTINKKLIAGKIEHTSVEKTIYIPTRLTFDPNSETEAR